MECALGDAEICHLLAHVHAQKTAVKRQTLGILSQFWALKRNLLVWAAHKRTDTKIPYFDLLLFSIGEEKKNVTLFESQVVAK